MIIIIIIWCLVVGFVVGRRTVAGDRRGGEIVGVGIIFVGGIISCGMRGCWRLTIFVIVKVHLSNMARMWEGASSARVVVIVGVGDSDGWYLVVDEVCDVECVDVGGGVTMLS